MTTLLSVVLMSVLSAASLNAGLYRGDACTFIPTGEQGVCQSLRSCLPARAALRAGYEPQKCRYITTVPIVCCTQGSQIPSSAVTVQPNTTITRKPAVSPKLSKYQLVETCPPLPEDAAHAKKRGQKAWDYCIDLALSVYPCKSASGFSLVTRYTRRNECGHLSTPLIIGGNATTPGEFPHMLRREGYATTHFFRLLRGYIENPAILERAALGYRNDNGIIWNWRLSHQRTVDLDGCALPNRNSQHIPVGEGKVPMASGTLARPTKHVRLGGGDIESPLDPGDYFTIIKTVRHPSYKPPAKYNDIALLKLDRDVQFNKMMRPACLHAGETVNDSKALVCGWGRTSQYGKMSNSLLKTTVEKFSYEACESTNPVMKAKLPQGVNRTTQVCYGHNIKKQDTCQGDSGGPLMIYNSDNVYCTYLVIAITSNGKICGVPGYPAIYTRVSVFIPWIESVIWP